MEFVPPWVDELKKLKEKGVLFLSVQEVSKITSISPTSIKRMCRTGELDAFKTSEATNAKWFIYIDSLIEYTKDMYSLNND